MRYVCVEWNPRNVWIIYCMRKFDKNSFSGEVSFEKIQNPYSPRFVSIVTTCAPFFKYTVFSVSLIFFFWLHFIWQMQLFVSLRASIFYRASIHSFSFYLIGSSLSLKFRWYWADSKQSTAMFYILHCSSIISLRTYQISRPDSIPQRLRGRKQHRSICSSTFFPVKIPLKCNFSMEWIKR